MKHVAVLVCGFMVLFAAVNMANAYTAELTYYFDALDVDTGAIVQDPMTFIILPADDIADLLAPPTDFVPSFSPAADLFVTFDPVFGTDWLVLLPKDESDASRIVEIRVGDELIQPDWSTGWARVEIPEGGEMIFVFADGRMQEVDLHASLEIQTVPEPGTLILLGLGILGLIGYARSRQS